MKKTAGILVLGFLLGLLAAGAVFIYAELRQESYVAKSPITLALGERGEHTVTLPAGTVLYHEAYFSEGFDQLVLYVNAPNREQFDIRHVSYIRPYWIRE